MYNKIMLCFMKSKVTYIYLRLVYIIDSDCCAVYCSASGISERIISPKAISTARQECVNQNHAGDAYSDNMYKKIITENQNQMQKKKHRNEYIYMGRINSKNTHGKHNHSSPKMWKGGLLHQHVLLWNQIPQSIVVEIKSRFFLRLDYKLLLRSLRGNDVIAP